MPHSIVHQPDTSSANRAALATSGLSQQSDWKNGYGQYDQQQIREDT